MKSLVIISLLIVLNFQETKSMCASPSQLKNIESNFLSTPIKNWKQVQVLKASEISVYNKTWNPKLSLESNISNLTDLFFDICCDFGFKIVQQTHDFVKGKSISNQSILFTKNPIATTFAKNHVSKYGKYNIIDNIGIPLNFTDSMKDQIRNYIKFIAKDSVGCKLLRIFIAKTTKNKLSKLIFIPLQKNSYAVKKEPINYYYGIDINKTSNLSIKQPYIYRYILFSPETLYQQPSVIAVMNNHDKLEYFYTKLPIDVILFNKITMTMHLNQTISKKNINNRLNIYKKKFSEKLNNKFSELLKITTEANLFCDQLSPTIFDKIIKLHGIKQYANQVVDTMSRAARLKHIEQVVSEYYTNDEVFRTQFGITEYGLDILNESSYSSHRYKWIRVSNIIDQESFNDVYETFIAEQGDTDVFNFYLSPTSCIKYPKFGVNQYKCSDIPQANKMKSPKQTPCRFPRFMISAMSNNEVRILSDTMFERPM